MEIKNKKIIFNAQELDDLCSYKWVNGYDWSIKQILKFIEKGYSIEELKQKLQEFDKLTKVRIEELKDNEHVVNCLYWLGASRNNGDIED